MIAVVDSGPLMALAKVDGLEILFQLHPKVVATPAVFAETVKTGQRLGAADARLLAMYFEQGRIAIRAPSLAMLPGLAKLGPGEDESIRLALELRAEWLLTDDLDARRAAEEMLATKGVGTRVKGTLGLIVSAHQKGTISLQEALRLLRSLGDRPDVWLSQKLILKVIESLTG